MEMENYKMVLVHVNESQKGRLEDFFEDIDFIIIRFKATPKESLVRVCDIKIIRYGREQTVSLLLSLRKRSWKKCYPI
ncbi:Uncharacterised protein [Fusobacterium necrophorum subsp. necrophorum]|nr:Uncharacterised protein [Fusobacterium necrophorum subsp. necrophorum]